MNTILFITFVIQICLGLFLLSKPYLNTEKWISNLMTSLLVVGGCAGAGVALFHLVN